MTRTILLALIIPILALGQTTAIAINFGMEITTNQFNNTLKVLNSYVYLNKDTATYHIGGSVKNILHETVDSPTLSVRFNDKQTDASLKDGPTQNLPSMAPGQVTTFDLDTGYNASQVKELGFIKAILTD
jgi:hypothetical protein